MDEWGGKPRESVTVMPPPPSNAGRGSGQAGPPFPSARARTAGTGDPTAYQPSRVSNSSEAAKLQNREAVRSERDFEETPAIPFQGRWRFSISFRCGECAQRNNAARAKARCINGVRKGVRLTTGTRKGRAPHRRGARKQETRKRKEGKCRKRRNACAAR